MKQFLIFTLILMTSLFVKGQNGGQFPENNVIRVEYIGYFNGNHVAKVCNKQNCEARIRTKAEQDPAVDVLVPADSCITILVPRPTSAAILFRAKAETSCPSFTNPDMGWLETNFISAVLNFADGNPIRIIREENKYQLTVTNGILSANFGSFSEYMTVMVYQINGNKLYDKKHFVNKNNLINLNEYFRPGLNFVKVFIHNKTYDSFLFKVFKN
jgi:hypothetical protein